MLGDRDTLKNAIKGQDWKLYQRPKRAYQSKIHTVEKYQVNRGNRASRTNTAIIAEQARDYQGRIIEKYQEANNRFKQRIKHKKENNNKKYLGLKYYQQLFA